MHLPTNLKFTALAAGVALTSLVLPFLIQLVNANPAPTAAAIPPQCPIPPCACEPGFTVKPLPGCPGCTCVPTSTPTISTEICHLPLCTACETGSTLTITQTKTGLCPTCSCVATSPTPDPTITPTPTLVPRDDPTCGLPLCPVCSTGSTLTLIQTNPTLCPTCSCVAATPTPTIARREDPTCGLPLCPVCSTGSTLTLIQTNPTLCPTCSCVATSATPTPTITSTVTLPPKENPTCGLPFCPVCSTGSTLTLIQPNPTLCPTCSCVAATSTGCPPVPTNCVLPCPCGYSGTLTRPATACASCACTQTSTCMIGTPTPVPP